MSIGGLEICMDVRCLKIANYGRVSEIEDHITHYDRIRIPCTTAQVCYRKFVARLNQK